MATATAATAQVDGAACHRREVTAVGREARLQRVCERPSGEGDDECRRCPTRRAGDRVAAWAHATFSVNGAVSTCPSTCVWRNSRQVPATGTSTPTVSLPGVVDVPVTFAVPDHARASGGAGAADVGVEVVERAGAEEDRVRQCAEPGAEDCGRAVWPRHRGGEECRPDRLQVPPAREREAIAVDDDGAGRTERRTRLLGSSDGDPAEQLEVRLRAGRRVGVGHQSVATRRRERDLRRDGAVGRDGRVRVDDALRGRRVRESREHRRVGRTPLRNAVNGFPEGCMILKDSVVGRPAWGTPAGRKSASWYVFARDCRRRKARRGAATTRQRDRRRTNRQ